MKCDFSECKTFLKVGMKVTATYPDHDFITGVVGEILQSCFYIWQNLNNGACGYKNPTDYGFKYSWCIGFTNSGSISTTQKLIKLKHKNGCEPQCAIFTGYEVKNYHDKNSAIEIGIKTKANIFFNRDVLKKVEKVYNADHAQIYLIGGKRNQVNNIIALEVEGGCEDTPHLSAQTVANAMNVFIAQGLDTLGFLISRGQSKMYNHYDSLSNNLLTWSKLFPKCYAVLVTPSKKWAWKISNEKIAQIEIIENEKNNKK